jgi:hypothetical protein
VPSPTIVVRGEDGSARKGRATLATDQMVDIVHSVIFRVNEYRERNTKVSRVSYFSYHVLLRPFNGRRSTVILPNPSSVQAGISIWSLQVAKDHHIPTV